MQTRKATGRPPNNPEKIKYYDTPLHSMLVRRFAPAEDEGVSQLVRGGRIDVNALASACDVVRFTIYRWFDADKLSMNAANKLVKISKGNLTTKDVSPFVFD